MIAGRVLLSLQRPLSLPGRGGRTTVRPAERPGPPRASMAPTLTVNQCGGRERLGKRWPLPRAHFKSSFVSEEEQERKGLPRRVAY